MNTSKSREAVRPIRRAEKNFNDLPLPGRFGVSAIHVRSMSGSTAAGKGTLVPYNAGATAGQVVHRAPCTVRPIFFFRDYRRDYGACFPPSPPYPMQEE
jgi:hypothetical protein